MNENPVGWFEIYVGDMSRSKAFYESVFQTKLELLPSTELEMWAFPMNENKYGSPGSLVKMEGCDPGGNSTIVYFNCEDCAEEEQRAVASGGKVFKTKFSIGPYGFIALVFDTEGNMIGLHSRK